MRLADRRLRGAGRALRPAVLVARRAARRERRGRAPRESMVRLENSITPARSAPAPAAPGRRRRAASRLHLTVTLKPRDPAALAAYASAVSTPRVAGPYRHYLSPDQFGRRFGATAAQLRTVRGAFARHGLRLGHASAGRLSIPLAADAGTIERGLDVQLRRVRGRRGRAVVAATRAPAIAAGAAAGVQSIVGLDSSSAPRPLTQRARRQGPLAQPLAAALRTRRRPRRPRRPGQRRPGDGAGGAAGVLAGDHRRRSERRLHRQPARDRVRLHRPVPRRRRRVRDDRRDLRAAAGQPVRHRRVRVLLRDQHPDLLRVGRRRRRPRRRLRRGRIRHREPDRLRARRQGARLPGAERADRSARFGPVRHVRGDRQPGSRPGRIGLMGRLRGAARPGRRPGREHAVSAGGRPGPVDRRRRRRQRRPGLQFPQRPRLQPAQRRRSGVAAVRDRGRRHHAAGPVRPRSTRPPGTASTTPPGRRRWPARPAAACRRSGRCRRRSCTPRSRWGAVVAGVRLALRPLARLLPGGARRLDRRRSDDRLRRVLERHRHRRRRRHGLAGAGRDQRRRARLGRAAGARRLVPRLRRQADRLRQPGAVRGGQHALRQGLPRRHAGQQRLRRHHPGLQRQARI